MHRGAKCGEIAAVWTPRFASFAAEGSTDAPNLIDRHREQRSLEDLDIETHLVKEGQIISKNSKSQAKLIHGIHLVMAKNYSENLREEVNKGMREKAEQGFLPGHAPFGYRNNKAERTIEVDPVDSITCIRMFEAFATGTHTLSTVQKAIRMEMGKVMSRANVHLVLKNRIYVGEFKWAGKAYPGRHPLFIDRGHLRSSAGGIHRA